MKLRKLFILALVAFGFASCSDYLEVDSPSKYDDEYIFTKSSEITRVLNGVYAQLLSGNLYGNYYMANVNLGYRDLARRQLPSFRLDAARLGRFEGLECRLYGR